MGPVSYSNQQISSVTSRSLNLPDVSSQATLSASHIVKTMMDKVSFELLGIKGNESTAASSASLAPVLGMALASMDDNARKELLLGIPPGSLTLELESKIHQKLGEFSKNHPYDSDQIVSLANFIATAFSTDEQIEQTLSECYLTQNLELENGDKNVADTADDFVKKKTKGKITTLFDGLTELERENVLAVIGNVMEFRLQWKKGFSSDEMATDSFLDAKGTYIDNVKMMCATDHFHVASYREFSAIAKEFRSVNGEDLKLVAIKPKKRNATAINNLDSDTINHLIGNLNGYKEKHKLKLPKIEVADSCNTGLLEKISQALGISIEAQDLTSLGIPSGDNDLHMVQKIKASIDKKGACGTIATAMAVITRSLAPTPCFDFDCPGYIGIIDSEGNRLLELVIKDDKFLELDGPRITSTRNLNVDDMTTDDESDNAVDSSDGSVIFSDDAVVSSDHKVDMSTLIQPKLNPNGEINIISAKADKTTLTIEVNSPKEAVEIEDRISKLIGKNLARQVRIWKIFNPIQIEVSFKPWKVLHKNLTS
ncbi:serpin family protein [Endozoicomonas sp. ONNA2]|uniref:serpin family protein n=1 Tax=Endozoicomonas sp. ONNA2 TaxID=2828741 RepID=UPI0021486F6D|nr:serpin family protein [Endozoicomonas sp. ONNA2]